AHRDLHSFPTRRSSDLGEITQRLPVGASIYGVFSAQQSALLCNAAFRHTGNPAFLLWSISVARWLGEPQVAALPVRHEGRESSRSEEHTSELQSRENLV